MMSGENPDLTERQRAILEYVVEGYVEAGQPVGSKTLTSRRGDTNVNVALRGMPPLNEMLVVVSRRHGPDNTHCPVPQFMTPAGYSPFSCWSVPVRSLKLIVCVPACAAT